LFTTRCCFATLLLGAAIDDAQTAIDKATVATLVTVVMAQESASLMPKARINGPRSVLFLSQKVLQTKTIQTVACFSGAAAARSGELFVNCRSRIPFCVGFEELAGIEAGLVEPEEFTALFRPCCVIQN